MCLDFGLNLSLDLELLKGDSLITPETDLLMVRLYGGELVDPSITLLLTDILLLPRRWIEIIWLFSDFFNVNSQQKVPKKSVVAVHG